MQRLARLRAYVRNHLLQDDGFKAVFEPFRCPLPPGGQRSDRDLCAFLEADPSDTSLHLTAKDLKALALALALGFRTQPTPPAATPLGHSAPSHSLEAFTWEAALKTSKAAKECLFFLQAIQK